MATPQKPTPPAAAVEESDDLVARVIAAGKAALAAMPLGHGVDTSSEARDALILIAQIHAIMGKDAPDFSQAAEFVEPAEDEQDGDTGTADTDAKA